MILKDAMPSYFEHFGKLYLVRTKKCFILLIVFLIAHENEALKLKCPAIRYLHEFPQNTIEAWERGLEDWKGLS